MFRTRFTKTAVSMLAATLFGVLTVGGCSDDDDDNGGGGGGGDPATLGEILTINNTRVYYNDSHWSGNSFRETYTPFNGSYPITTDYNIGGSGSVTNGQLNFTIGTPENLRDITDSFDDFEWFERNYDNFYISDPTAKVAHLYLEIPNDRGYLHRSRYVMTQNTNTNRAGFEEEVTYIYVDRDITMSGRGKTRTETWSDGSDTRTTRNFSVNLKRGWNILYEKWEESGTYNAANDTWNWNSTITMSHSNPSNRWIIRERFDWDSPPSLPPANHTPLTEGQWRDGTFSSRVVHFYSFSVTEGTRYYLWDNDQYGDGSKTADIMADVWYADGTRARHSFDDYFDYPAQFTASQSGTVYVRVYPEYSLGTYSIVFSTSDTRPGSSKIVELSLNRTANDRNDKNKTRNQGMFRSSRIGDR